MKSFGKKRHLGGGKRLINIWKKSAGKDRKKVRTVSQKGGSGRIKVNGEIGGLDGL